MTTKVWLWVFIGTLSIACTKKHGDEPVESRDQLLKKGYVHAPPSRPGAPSDEVPDAHSLLWPVEFQDRGRTIGNSMAQMQPYDGTYFHGGNDLRVNAGAEVHTPVSGWLEGGHYSYATNPNGSMEKYWLTWPQRGSPTYFEIAVTTDDGVRYEFHHINRATLSSTVLQMLNQGGARVEAGTLVGHTIFWPDGEYHHIHYNIVLPNGVRVNPEHASVLLPDHFAPSVGQAFAILHSGLVLNFGDGNFSEQVREFVVSVIDRLDDSAYEHPPSAAFLKFKTGASSGWDFRRTLSLLSDTALYPDLWSTYVRELKTPQGEILKTEGGYGMGRSLVRLPVPAGAVGEFSIELSDIAGNQALLSGSLSR